METSPSNPPKWQLGFLYPALLTTFHIFFPRFSYFLQILPCSNPVRITVFPPKDKGCRLSSLNRPRLH